MKKGIISSAAVVGFLVPLYWLVMAFGTFTAPQSASADRFWAIVHITCPFFDMLDGFVSLAMICVLNACLYSFAAWSIWGTLSSFKRWSRGGEM